MPTPLESIRIVATRLSPLNVRFVFLGGAVVPLLVDHPTLMEFRPTKDVDVIVELISYPEFSAFEERLRAAGFKHDTSEGAPIYRWIVENCRVDVMPMDSRPLGMNTSWFREALQLSNLVDLGEGREANVIAPALFLATKLEAFQDRGKGDYYSSHDLEDIITVVDGRPRIVEDVSSAPEAVRAFISGWFTHLLSEADFRDAFPGHLSGMTGARQAAPLVMKRFEKIAALR